MARIAVFGMGYVGCVTATCLSRDGHQVMGVDIDESKVALVNQGVPPVSEPGLGTLLAGQVKSKRLQATTDGTSAVRNSDVALVAVGTPSAPDGSVSTVAVERVIEMIGQVLRSESRDYTVVLRSTLLPGILEDQLAPLLEEASGCPLGTRIHLCNNPEFLRETTAIADYDKPPFIVVGANDPIEADVVLGLYEGLPAEHIVTDTRTAALVKYACNAFHAAKIDFANEIGSLAKSLGANGQEVMKIACRDRQLNISPAYLRPGFAFGGSCLPKDVRALTRFAQQQAISIPLLSSILPSNDVHLERALAIIRESKSKQIGLVGLSFKAGTDDLRESPQVILAETLLGRGYDLKIYDPGVRPAGLVGSNQSFVDQHLPHLASLLVDDAVVLFEHANLLVIGTGVADEILAEFPFTGQVIDLRKDLVVPDAPALAASRGSFRQ